MLDLARDGLLYLDTSALMKLVVDEDETPALRQELARWTDGRFVTSALTRVELPRAIRRVVPERSFEQTLFRVRALLDALFIVPITETVLAAAAELDPPQLRSLDAIHLASARAITTPDVSPVLCGYDDRLQGAGRSLGLLAISPGR